METQQPGDHTSPLTYSQGSAGHFPLCLWNMLSISCNPGTVESRKGAEGGEMDGQAAVCQPSVEVGPPSPGPNSPGGDAHLSFQHLGHSWLHRECETSLVHKRSWSRVARRQGGSGRIWGEGKNMIKICIFLNEKRQGLLKSAPHCLGTLRAWELEGSV